MTKDKVHKIRKYTGLAIKCNDRDSGNKYYLLYQWQIGLCDLTKIILMYFIHTIYKTTYVHYF